MPSDNYKPCTRKAQCFPNELFTFGGAENNDDYFLLNLLILQREQQKELRNMNPKISTYILDRGSGYYMQELDKVEIICYDSKIYMP